MTTPVAGAEDRGPEVAAMFDQLAPRYDRANRVLSLGLDQRWRRAAIQSIGEASEVLDLCAGTLDLSQMLLAEGAQKVTAVDFSAEMLAAGRSKLSEDDAIITIQADARDLPLADASVDAIVCGFGLRNVPELPRAIAECARVLRPGGRIAVLDFFRPTTAVSRVIQGSYNRFIVPVVGGALTGFADAYRYLEQSIDAFVTADEFVALLATHGLQGTHRTMVPPVAHLVTAVRERVDHD